MQIAQSQLEREAPLTEGRWDGRCYLAAWCEINTCDRYYIIVRGDFSVQDLEDRSALCTSRIMILNVHLGGLHHETTSTPGNRHLKCSINLLKGCMSL